MYCDAHEKIYYALGDFIYVYLQQHQIDKCKIINHGVVCAIRDTTMEYMKNNMDILIKELINRGEPNVA